MSGHTPPSPTPQALRLQEEWPGVLWLEWEGGEMQSEASEVTLGGKAHVGPGCVCTTRHQPSWLDRGILFSFVLCVSLFYFTTLMTTLGGVNWSWEREEYFLWHSLFPRFPLQLTVRSRK